MERKELKRIFNKAIDEVPDVILDNVEGHILMLYTTYHPQDHQGGFLSTFAPNIRELPDNIKFGAIVRFIKDLGFIDQRKMNNMIATLSKLI